MIYVIDTSVISALHRNYYPKNFPSLWKLFDGMVAEGRVTSTREAHRELEAAAQPAADWAKNNAGLFVIPDANEGKFVAGIYAVPHFQNNIERQKILKGGKNADPFLIARAACIKGIVLTMEHLQPHAAKIPNICDHFNVPCVDLEQFMQIEKWTF
jgi:hypothetical protein